MKNIFKYMIPCLAVAFGLTSCNSTEGYYSCNLYG